MNICIGIPGGPPSHRTTDDLVAGICPTCELSLTSGLSWGNQLHAVSEVKQRGGRKGGGKRESTEWRNYAVKFPKKQRA